MSIQSEHMIEILRVGEFQAGKVERVGYIPALSQICLSLQTDACKSYTAEDCS